jgi:GNAT superfamily N-acetyltransferase
VGVTVRPLALSDAEGCDAIMRGLPDYFGHEGGLAAYREAVRSQAGLIAAEAGKPVGFAIWEPRTAATAEITWMAVERNRRHAGIGTAIIEALAADLARRGFRLALAMTSAGRKPPRPEPDIYEATRRFWIARGFLPLIELDIWDVNFALLLVRPLAP